MDLEIRTKRGTYIYMSLGIISILLGLRLAYLEVYFNAAALVLIGLFMCKSCFQRTILSISAKPDADKLTYFNGSHFSSVVEFHELFYKDITEIKSIKQGRKFQLISPRMIIDIPAEDETKGLITQIANKNPSIETSEVNAIIK